MAGQAQQLACAEDVRGAQRAIGVHPVHSRAAVQHGVDALVAMLRRNSGFSVEKARARLGYEPARQWEESLDETLAWCDRAAKGARE